MTELANQIRAGRTACSRCGGELSTYTTDVCWYCRLPLCADCYRNPGHCGHDDAVEILRRLAERRKLLAQQRAGRWTLGRLAAFYGVGERGASKYCRLWGLGQRNRANQVIALSGEDVRKFGEALEVLRLRRNPSIVYRPPWPEWVRIYWREQGYKENPIKP